MNIITTLYTLKFQKSFEVQKVVVQKVQKIK